MALAILTAEAPRNAAVAPLVVFWRVAAPTVAPTEKIEAIFSSDPSTIITATPRNVTALSAADGHTIWERRGAGSPIASVAQTLFAVTGDNRIVAIDVKTHRDLWTTRSFGKASVDAIAASPEIVVIGIDTHSVDVDGGVTMGLSARTGRVLWSHRGPESYAYGRRLQILETSIVSTLDVIGEPDVDAVEVFDRRTGQKLFYAEHATFLGAYRHELWLSSTRLRDDFEPAFIERYQSGTGRRLGDYVYAPDPRRNIAMGDWFYPYGISERDFFIDAIGRLYRYDRSRPPAEQQARSFDFAGALTTVLGSSPVLIDERSVTVLVPNGDNYVGRSETFASLGLGKPGSSKMTTGTGKATVTVTEASLFWTRSPRKDMGYFTIGDDVAAVTENGQFFVTAGRACVKPKTVIALSERTALAQCDSNLILLRPG